ncbi:MAG: phosphoribosylanthranilate isomerase [Synechococcales cyanobacterium T60_A2020_003]|nr:phosphoribosylanthranilate isomerase [Synechococcales cyanobacterium T60_A2020_003]
MKVKICGITQPDQGRAIAQLGADALGFICVRSSPRYVMPVQIHRVIAGMSDLASEPGYVGVFANAPVEEIVDVVAQSGVNAVQLHGQESPAFCEQLRAALPGMMLIKAFRIRVAEDLCSLNAFTPQVDALLLDAYHPHLLGGTGKTLDWAALHQFQPDRPWFLAGGLTPENVQDALSQLQPNWIDLSSGVERSPGDKDLTKVAKLFEALMFLNASKKA